MIKQRRYAQYLCILLFALLVGGTGERLTEASEANKNSHNKIYILQTVKTAIPVSASFVVAAENSVHKNRANYVVPNGSTSAQAVINQAISALPSYGGKVILLEGTYLVDGSIAINDRVTIKGQGEATIIKVRDGLNANITVIVNSNSVTGNADIEIEGITFDGNRANNSSGVQSGISFSRASASKVNFCSVRNFRNAGIVFQSSSRDSSVLSNTISGNDVGIVIDSSEAMNIRNNFIVQNTTDNIYANNSSSILSSGNFLMNAANGVAAFGSSSGLNINSSIITGNASGVYLSSTSETIIYGNLLRGNTGSAIDALTASITSISENIIALNSGNGIRLDSNSLRHNVARNLISGNGFNGLLVMGGSHEGSVSGNAVFLNGLDGIRSVADDSLVSANLVASNSTSANNTYSGIFLSGNRVSAQQNLVRRGAGANRHQYGIFLSSGTGGFIVSNDLLESGVTSSLQDSGTGTNTTPGNKTL